MHLVRQRTGRVREPTDSGKPGLWTVVFPWGGTLPGMKNLSEPLRRWFAAAARDLPWRTSLPRDPYHVLVSETMLQQTQVTRVVPVFEAFLRRFPTLRHLAEAENEDVLEAFSGLGYYRRAQRLHAAAQWIHSEGKWPRTAPELARLPGIGRYTAAAVAAFAFGGSEPLVDGNVMRVAARLLACDLPVGHPHLEHQAREIAGTLAGSPPDPSLWEGLMELGATVCLPRGPRCSHCPLRTRCRGFLRGRPEDHPSPRARRRQEHHTWVAAWVAGPDARVLLQRRPEGAILPGLWVPPMAEVQPGMTPSPEAIPALLPFSLNGVEPRPCPRVSHTITYRRISVFPFLLDLRHAPVQSPPGDLWRWCPVADPRVATSSLLAKLGRVCPPKEDR